MAKDQKRSPSVVGATLRILTEGFMQRSYHAINRLLGYSIKLRLISLEVDLETRNAKQGKEVFLNLGDGTKGDDNDSDTTYISVSVPVDAGFGTPGAISVESYDPNEFFLKSITLTLSDTENTTLFFPCHSWINHVKFNSGRPRFFFSNQLCLPRDTPLALTKIRREELLCLRGDGKGERNYAERIYEYDIYNDLGDIDSDITEKRPILGGSADYPCPRRVRTGRSLAKSDPDYEKHMTEYNKTYVPRDERFSPLKKKLFMTVGARSFFHSIVSDMGRLWQNDKSFKDLNEINSLYDGKLEPTNKRPPVTLAEIPYLIFPPPGVVQANTEGWKTDEEFGRQRLAGSNPHVIKRIKVFPLVSSLDPKIYGPPTSSITAMHLEPYLENHTVDEALEKHLLYVVDYYDMYIPYLHLINEPGKRATYAPRVILYLSTSGTLLPIAIELALPSPIRDGEIDKRIFTPNRSVEFDWPWHFAKAHFLAVDTTYQLSVSHWLRTHASLEPIIMAARRHLSTLHPLHALLDPHFKDTINLGSEGRIALINAGGRIEKNFAAGRYTMEMVCKEYKNWRFDEQALPKDLLSRGVAIEDPSAKHGVRLTIEDYPYAADGLDLWGAIKQWAHAYVHIYYKTNEEVQEDEEVQSWWKEVKEVGHGDHKGKEWWPKMESVKEVEEVIATIIWVTSGFHASVNFGNYPYSGYVPNSLGMTRQFIPNEGTLEWEKMMNDPHKFYMDMIPSQGVATITMATFEALGHHVEEEEYLGDRPETQWTSNKHALKALESFRCAIADAEASINARNAASTRLSNRAGPVKLPYTLLTPSSGGVGMTFRGVPNSISM